MTKNELADALAAHMPYTEWDRDGDHQGTWCECGFVISVPKEPGGDWAGHVTDLIFGEMTETDGPAPPPQRPQTDLDSVFNHHKTRWKKWLQ